jgi:hypothetical protein
MKAQIINDILVKEQENKDLKAKLDLEYRTRKVEEKLTENAIKSMIDSNISEANKELNILIFTKDKIL